MLQMKSHWFFLAGTLLLVGCNRERDALADPAIAAGIQQIRAIDNHAHPVRPMVSGPPDREFDALPVDNMEPASDPLSLRPNAPATLEAAKQFPNKQSLMRDKGDSYPAWVLDQMGVDIMLANRVAMGNGIQPPRFRWGPYADALIFPLDNSNLAARNPD